MSLHLGISELFPGQSIIVRSQRVDVLLPIMLVARHPYPGSGYSSGLLPLPLRLFENIRLEVKGRTFDNPTQIRMRL